MIKTKNTYNRVKFKLFAAFLFLIFFTSIPLYKYSKDKQNQMIRTYVEKTNDAFTEFISSDLITSMRQTREILKVYSSSPLLRDMDKKSLKSTLRKIVRSNDLFKAAGLYNHRKTLVTKTKNFEDIRNMDNLYSKTFLHVFGINLFDKSTNSLQIKSDNAEYRVLITKDQRIVGALIVQLDMSYFQEKLNELKNHFDYTNDYANVYILDESNRIIASSKSSSHPVDSIFPPLESFEKEKYIKKLKDSKGGEDAPPWKVIFVPKDTAYKNMEDFEQFFSVSMTIFIFFAIFLGWRVSKMITRPLSKLLWAVKQISKGDLDTPISSHSGDEIGVLAGKFDEMRVNLKDYQDHLKKKISELQILYQVGSIISEELDYNHLLTTILNTVIDVMGAEKGSIMIYDESTKMLKIASAKGLKHSVVRQTVLASGESIAGHVFQSKEPMLVYDTMKSQDFIKIKRRKVTPGTMLSVPLVYKDNSLGVINISKPMPYSFNDFDLNLFQAIANICATAIENARLYKLAITDEMTNLYIRRFFYQSMNQHMLKKDASFSLIMLDIDHFKNFNDTYGHATGDKVLIQVAQIIASSVRDCDVPCRLGGEEFAIICPNQRANEAIIPSNRLKKLINSAVIEVPDGSEVQIGISIGISEYPHDGKTIDELYEAVDKALYYSKENGRNQVTVYKDLPKSKDS
ncbi:MAG: diguanylate cyclase [Candidatus Cloacimonetes bacterium]|nr:diguanylate cyclase [Candidatus Cloacimonadota bacterium]